MILHSIFIVFMFHLCSGVIPSDAFISKNNEEPQTIVLKKVEYTLKKERYMCSSSSIDHGKVKSSQRCAELCAGKSSLFRYGRTNTWACDQKDCQCWCENDKPCNGKSENAFDLFEVQLLAAGPMVMGIADFNVNVRNEWRVLKSNLTGVLLNNGNFIFYLDIYGERKLVMTSNKGEMLKSGNLLLPANTWMDESSWNAPTDSKVTNFQGIEDKMSLDMNKRMEKMEQKLKKAINVTEEMGGYREYKKEDGWIVQINGNPDNLAVVAADPMYNTSRWHQLENGIQKLTRIKFEQVHGGWGAWSGEICQAGVQLRSRVCDSPIPLNGGKQCEGLNIDVINKFTDCKEKKTTDERFEEIKTTIQTKKQEILSAVDARKKPTKDKINGAIKFLKKEIRVEDLP